MGLFGKSTSSSKTKKPSYLITSDDALNTLDTMIMKYKQLLSAAAGNEDKTDVIEEALENIVDIKNDFVEELYGLLIDLEENIDENKKDFEDNMKDLEED